MTDARAITFLPYQRRWLQDASRFKIGMFGRQSGKTFTTCGEATDASILAMMAGRRERWVILSRGERQAAEAIQENIARQAQGYFAAYNVLKDGRDPDGFEIGEIQDAPAGTLDAEYSRLEVRFPGGSRITALPANPDTARGYSANVILDEFAFHRDSRKIWGALLPVISAPGLKLRVVSTPNGKGNKFYELMTGKGDGWSRHHVDIHKAVADGLDRDVPGLQAAMGDPDLWSQEFELQWLDGASAWLSYDLISGAEHPAAGDPGGYQGGPCFIGVDIAARNDLFVIWVDELVGDVLWTREIFAKRRLSFAAQDAELARIFDSYRVIRCCMDQTGMGEKPVEDAQRRYGADRVQGVLFTPAAKLGLATTLKTRVEDRTKRLPAGDPLLRADLHAVQKQAGATGVPRLVADSDTDGHADRFWAGALAAEAAEAGDYQPYVYSPVRTDDEQEDAAPVWGVGAGGFGGVRGVW